MKYPSNRVGRLLTIVVMVAAVVRSAPGNVRWCSDGDGEDWEPSLGTVENPGRVRRTSKVGDVLDCPFSFPVVFEGKGFEMFPGLRSWQHDLETIKRLRVPKVLNSYDSSENGIFTYFDERAPLRAPRAYSRVLNGSSDTFWESLHSVEGRRFVRYGGPIETWAPDLLDEDVARFANERIPSKYRSKISLFVGSPHVVSTAHFDNHRNFYTVVTGTKEFLFARPRDIPRFRIYPAAHPNARQGQLHFDDRDSEVSLSDVAITRAFVQPGDMLYIPPGWIHHVRSGSEGPQIAISVTAQTPELLWYNRWLRSTSGQLLPFLSRLGGTWGFGRISAALDLFIPQLVNEELAASHVLSDLARIAYAPHIRRALGIRKPRGNFPCHEDPISENDAEVVVNAAREVGKWFATNVTQPWSRDTFLSSYLETVLGRLGGQVPMTAGLHFLDDCILRPMAPGGRRRRRQRQRRGRAIEL